MLDTDFTPMVSAPESWNEWGAVDFSVGFILAIYMSVASRAYGHTCYNVALSHAFGSMKNLKYFATGINWSSKSNLSKGLFIFHWV